MHRQQVVGNQSPEGAGRYARREVCGARVRRACQELILPPIGIANQQSIGPVFPGADGGSRMAHRASRTRGPISPGATFASCLHASHREECFKSEGFTTE